MPVAVITAATCDDECVVRTTLDRLGIAPVRNPSTIVVGEVAARDVLNDPPVAALLALDPTGVPR
jgi:siroheme synthase